MESELRRSILLGMAAILAGCGGGGESPSPAPGPVVKKSKMTLLIYIAGSNLESDHDEASNNINEMLNAVDNPDVNVILQTGGAAKLGWTSIRRRQIKSQKIIELEPAKNPDASFADPQTLVDFVQWSKDNFPAERYIFSFWNHGGGPIGGFGGDEINLYKEQAQLRTNDIQKALEKSTQILGQKFEMVGFDCCLMASFEIISAIKNTTKYYIASEELEPGGGWSYTPILNYIANNPQASGSEISKIIIDAYIDKNKEDQSITLSSIDISKFQNLEDSLSLLFKALHEKILSGGTDAFSDVLKSRSQSLDFVTNIFMGKNSQDLMDIGSFLVSPQLQKVGIPNALIENAKSALSSTVISSKTGSLAENATGITLWFPSLSIRESEAAKNYIKYVPEISGVSNFMQTISNIARNGYLPKIGVTNLIRAGNDSISATVSSEYYDEAYAALMKSNGTIVSFQNIKGNENSITLDNAYTWPTINGKPISLAANKSSNGNEQSYITYGKINSLDFTSEVILIFNEKYVCKTFYEIDGEQTHMSAPRIEKIPPSAEIVIPTLAYNKGAINPKWEDSFQVIADSQGSIFAEMKIISTNQLYIFLGASDLVGEISFSSQSITM